jgi:hypothetical protein
LKKSLLLIPIFALAVSCNQEEIQSYDKLTPSEQAAIRAMGQTQCLAKVQANYNAFKDTSDAIFASSSYERGDGYYFEFKTGTSVEKSVHIKVWKQTSTEIYFYITDSRAGGDYFLRYERTVNDQIITDLQTAHCLRPEIYSSNISSSTLTMSFADYRIAEAPNYGVYTDTYTMPFTSPAFFANYNVTRTKKVVDSSDVIVEAAKTYTSAALVSKPVTYTSSNATDSTLYNQKFCVIHQGTDGYRFAQLRNVEGFEIQLSNTVECAIGTVPAGWNLTI